MNTNEHSEISRASLTETFNLMFNDVPLTEVEEAASAAYDAEQAVKLAEVQDAYDRFIAGTNDLEDALRLEKAGLVVAIYGRGDDERPTGFRLRKIDGNEYTDQTGLEQKPGRL